MQGSIRCVVLAGLLLGCDPGDTTTPDDGDTTGTSGLKIEWSSSPSSWPSTVDLVTLTRARFGLNTLRVVGDAGPGDPRTTQGAMELGFAWSSSEQRPTAITFDDAPTGLYSQVALMFDRPTSGSEDDTYELEGTVTVGSQLYDWQIQDNSALTFNVAIDKMVTPGEVAVVSLRINFTHALDSVIWSTLNESDGRLELDTSDPQMLTFRSKLIESFEIVNAGGVR